MGKMLSEAATDKILSFVMPGKDFSLQEIADGTGLNRNTVSKYVLILEAERKLIQTRTVGHAKLYTKVIVLPKEVKDN